MAVNMDEDLDVQIPEESDIFLFADNLVDYIISQGGRNSWWPWESVVFRYPFYNTAVCSIQRSTHFLDNILVKCETDLFMKIKESNFLNTEFLAKFSETLREKCFSKDFGAKYILLYCVIMSNIAYYFCHHDVDGATSLVKKDMHALFESYFVTNDGCNDIRSNAENFEKMITDFENDELTLSSIGHLSDEIVEMGNESNYLLSEEESVLLRNAECDTEEQTQRARLKIKKYLELYDQYSSNSESKTGPCSLVEPELLSEDESLKCKFEGKAVINESERDDKPRLCTSYIFGELIYNICNFKMMVKLSWNEMKSGNYYVMKDLN